MEQAIANEWGRFLKDLEAKRIEGLTDISNNNHDGAGPEPASPRSENTEPAVWQRLQDAIALPPAPDVPLFDESTLPTADQPRQTPASANRTPWDQFRRTPVERQDRLTRVNQPAADTISALQPKSTAQSENGSFQVRSMWVGTGFEDRRILVKPPSPQTSPMEKQQELMRDDISTQPTPSSTPAEEDLATASAPPLAVVHEEAPLQWNPIRNANLDDKLKDASASVTEPSNGSYLPGVQNQDSARWFVLHGMLGGAPASQEAPDEPANVPVLELFSLAGGVGKTSLAATLGRALSARGERVLLVEATPFGSLPYFFGACDCRPGELRTFRPPASSTDAPIQLATVDTEALLSDGAADDSLAAEIENWARGVGRVIVDVATLSTATARALSRLSPAILVPLLPDVNSVMAATSIDSYFDRHEDAPGAPAVYYVLNQFDPSQPLHQDVRKLLQDRLGERLLPFTLQRTPALSEALAEGMTIMDYAPEAPETEDFISLAKWIETVLPAADVNSRRARWSER